MVVPAPRDPDVTREILTGWFGDPVWLPGARITDLRTPEFTGFSSEILMVDVEHDGVADALAVRAAPSHCRVSGDPAVRRHRLVHTTRGMVDAVARFEYDGHTGYGLYEYWALGDHPSFR